MLFRSEDVIGIDADHAIPCSAKTGEGIDDILEAVIERMPPPRGTSVAPLRAMIVDSWFDNYVGVVMLVRVVDGRLAKGERIRMMASDAVYGAEHLGVFTPKSEPRDALEAGEVGFVIAGIRELQAAKVGDTITLEKKLPNNLGPALFGSFFSSVTVSPTLAACSSLMPQITKPTSPAFSTSRGTDLGVNTPICSMP